MFCALVYAYSLNQNIAVQSIRLNQRRVKPFSSQVEDESPIEVEDKSGFPLNLSSRKRGNMRE